MSAEMLQKCCGNAAEMLRKCCGKSAEMLQIRTRVQKASKNQNRSEDNHQRTPILLERPADVLQNVSDMSKTL